jgi:Raf kinase inhibitor-like YbhB/YbcL family protein
MRITSTAFDANAKIPQKYSCDGEDAAPALAFGDMPAGARSLALIVDDPDAPRGDWVHWVVYDLPPSTTLIPEGGKLPAGAKVGVNDFGKKSYGGPCPPPGKPHRYFFKLYALDAAPDLPAGATKAALLEAIDGHVLAEAQLIGTYGR